MAREKVFFQNAGKIHPVFLTPNVSLFYSAIWSAFLVCSGTFDQITNLIIFCILCFFWLGGMGIGEDEDQRGCSVKSDRLPCHSRGGYPVLFSACDQYPGRSTRASLLGLLLILSGVPFYLYFKYRMR